MTSADPPSRPVRRDDLDADPLVQFRRWYEAWRADVDDVPEAVVLSTADGDGRPSSRYVLLRRVDHGFVVYSNLRSRKGRELAVNPRAALCFGWHAHRRQVRVEGSVELVDDATADAYWATRPRRSRVAASASDQSEPIEDRATLDARVAAIDARFGADDIPRPAHWGGLRVVPSAVEFWQGGDHRLHDRFLYRRDGDAWSVTRLMP